MINELTEQDRKERDAIVAAIGAAFDDTTREGGISWNECVAIDGWRTDEECETARHSDKDTHWNQLLDDPNWHPFPGLGGFSFIDAVGFRYYLPPTMIRILRGEEHDWYPGHFLSVIDRFTESHLLPLWSSAHLQVIAQFMTFMARHDEDGWFNDDENVWFSAIIARWGAYLPK